MVQLRSCYFCGTTGALSEYEALPPELGTASEASPRVILCDRCHTKLTNVLAPLVDSVGRGDADVGVRPDVSDGHSPSDSPTPGDGDSSTDEADSDAPEADGRPNQPEVTFTRPATPADEATDEPTAEATDEPADSNADRTPPADGAGDAAGGDSETDVAGDEVGVEGDSTTVADEHADAPGAESEAADDTATESAGAASATPSATDLDRVYHKLLRFLRNREFPIPRTEAETIAQSAYDLTAAEASQVIQRTIDRDVLEERDGELHRR